MPDGALITAIRALVADLPTYGYRRVHALLRRQAEQSGRPAPNVKRVYRVMKVHGLLLQRHAGSGEQRRHEGKVAVRTRNTRWCSDGLEIGCENGERVRVAFALDCCDREAMSFVATTAGITGEDVRDLMVSAVEHRFGRVNRLASPIGWKQRFQPDRQRQLLPRPRDPPLCQGHRLGAVHDTSAEPAIQWHGRGVRPNLETRLRAGLPRPGRRGRAAATPRLAQALQRGPPPSRAGLSLTSRVHQSINPGGPARQLRGNNSAHPCRRVRAGPSGAALLP